jgi:hypothetical protein
MSDEGIRLAGAVRRNVDQRPIFNFNEGVRHHSANARYGSKNHKSFDPFVCGRMLHPDFYVGVTMVSEWKPIRTALIVDQANAARLICLRSRNARDRIQRDYLQVPFAQPTLMALGRAFSDYIIPQSSIPGNEGYCPSTYIGQALDRAGKGRAKPLKILALPSGIEPLSPP